MCAVPITVFTKPWLSESLPELADKLAAIGLDGVELAVRPGYQVTPETAAAGLQDASRIFAARGLTIASIASAADVAMIAACGDAGIPLIRVMAPIDMQIGYRQALENHQRSFDALLPALDRHNVTIGVQNHYGFFIGSSTGLLHLLGRYEPRHVCAVLDMAHCALDGEPVSLAVDIIKDHLYGLVNFKSAYRTRVNGPEDEALFKVRWTTHRHGAYSWGEFADCLHRIGFRGTLCLPAEYSNPDGGPQRMGDDVLPFLRKDLAHLRELTAHW
ncbi:MULTISPECIES: TIM barrel protein [unclassified Chelatococcus]|uniref:sugar phosphate isomerase/epimerase family protein n=1 Tax=unclassified Chelatococcus TaxID=2638111 RepID=UPI001BCDEB96|nr:MULTISPECIES: TIM barrel protein [unclassified Chelatococcus]MBS7701214.1 TIM barrel protein [Chelatococcus sp. YT9]MBX3557345.1 TIM barrel protein [Chelatococcus sp.]